MSERKTPKKEEEVAEDPSDTGLLATKRAKTIKAEEEVGEAKHATTSHSHAQQKLQVAVKKEEEDADDDDSDDDFGQRRVRRTARGEDPRSRRCPYLDTINRSVTKGALSLLPVCMCACASLYLSTSQPLSCEFLRACACANIDTVLQLRLLVCLFACLLVCLFACLLVCLFVCFCLQEHA